MSHCKKYTKTRVTRKFIKNVAQSILKSCPNTVFAGKLKIFFEIAQKSPKCAFIWAKKILPVPSKVALTAINRSIWSHWLGHSNLK